MSKKNKVNPGQYTQAGRLSQDDAARALRDTAVTAGLRAKRQRPESGACRGAARTTQARRGGRYSAPFSQGPVIANEIPGAWRLANSHSPFGL